MYVVFPYLQIKIEYKDCIMHHSIGIELNQSMILYSCKNKCILFLKVVLIGDHKQLRPIVMNNTARRLGLEKSLFERYAVMKTTGLIMLNEQYRMVNCLLKINFLL